MSTTVIPTQQKLNTKRRKSLCKAMRKKEVYMYLSNFPCVMGITYIGQFAPLVFAES